VILSDEGTPAAGESRPLGSPGSALNAASTRVEHEMTDGKDHEQAELLLPNPTTRPCSSLSSVACRGGVSEDGPEDLLQAAMRAARQARG